MPIPNFCKEQRDRLREAAAELQFQLDNKVNKPVDEELRTGNQIRPESLEMENLWRFTISNASSRPKR